MAINPQPQPLPAVLPSTVRLRFKSSELEIDPSTSQITRLAVDYDLIVNGVTTSKTWQEAPDDSQQFQVWRLLRIVLGPLFQAEGIVPPAPLRPEGDARAPSPLATADPLASIQKGPAT